MYVFFFLIYTLLQNVVAWTNLGTLYLKKENIEVGHQLSSLFTFFCSYN